MFFTLLHINTNSLITTAYTSKNSISFLGNQFNFKTSHTSTNLEGLLPVFKMKKKKF